MDTKQKIGVIQKMLGLTQTKLAERLEVSFPTLNSWKSAKSTPRPKLQAIIDQLFLEVTGQKIIPQDMLVAKKEKIDEVLVLKLHSILMNGVRPDAGVYRNHAVRITGVNLPVANYMSIPKIIHELIAKIESKEKDILDLSASVHSKFEQIYPFGDGNGRVGRLLMNAILLEANFAPAVILQQQKQLYYTYLYKTQTTEDQSQLENFLCDAIVYGFEILERKDK